MVRRGPTRGLLPRGECNFEGDKMQSRREDEQQGRMMWRFIGGDRAVRSGHWISCDPNRL
ncbi:Polypeptide N-acetylgalactosaminyltransferase 11, partial [Clarias magur]